MVPNFLLKSKKLSTSHKMAFAMLLTLGTLAIRSPEPECKPSDGAFR
jgi:hypothetical protein